MNKRSVIKLVNEALKKHTHVTLGADVLVNTKDLRKDGDWWLVPVHTSVELKRVYDYLDVLANAMEDLENHELKVQFIPL